MGCELFYAALRRLIMEVLLRPVLAPAPVVQDHMHVPLINAALASRWFAQLTFTPCTRRIEAEFSRRVFGASSARCSDCEARWRAHEIALPTGILDLNEEREVKGWSPRLARPAPKPVERPVIS